MLIIVNCIRVVLTLQHFTVLLHVNDFKTVLIVNHFTIF